jgi:hypothetical protein
MTQALRARVEEFAHEFAQRVATDRQEYGHLRPPDSIPA